jgi:hypothetical protein
MEEIEYDFSFPIFEPAEIKYVAVFDKDSGAVISVGPEESFAHIDHKIQVDKEFVDGIVECKINIHNCFIDFYDLKLEIKEVKSLFKIDDVLHRIPESKFVAFKDADVYVTYDRNKSKLVFELTERFHGTRPLLESEVKKQKMIWSGDTSMDFYLTEYNDPHQLLKTVKLTLDDLIGKSFETDLQLPEKFSIFTRRLFKNYIMETL